jgi:high mobility group protein B1
MVKKAVRTKKIKKAADGPKKPKSGFMFYSQERRVTLRVEQPSLSVTDASKVIGAEWKALSEADKKRYQDMGEADRKRYSDEKEAKADS